MAEGWRGPEAYELLARRSSDSAHSFHNSGHEYHDSPPFLWSLQLLVLHWVRLSLQFSQIFYGKVFRLRRARRRRMRGIFWVLLAMLCTMILLIVFTAAVRPSYAHLPDHYRALQRRCQASKQLGRGNVNNEKIFIAATLYDAEGALVGGDWGSAVLELVDLLGPANVHLSVYENDPDIRAKVLLENLSKGLSCNSSLISEHLSLDEIPRVVIPSGGSRISRIAFLAYVRNRALEPLEAISSTHYDKLLFINDISFNPVDAVQLLFSTNIDSLGRTQYGAACAVDFINPFKFYDTYATRDLEGYSLGIPIFPWFTDAGGGASRQDVLRQKDAVRVRSCWGGMTAFEAQWFQDITPKTTLPNDGNYGSLSISPLRFRHEEDPFWEASECCLIHADLAFLRHGNSITTDSGIFMNPYVRVAYDASTLRWLPYTQRIERLYPLIHNILNHMIGMPWYNPRRLEQPGDEVQEKVWEFSNTGGSFKHDETGNGLLGSYSTINRTAGPGRFCGTRTLLVLKENPKKGEKNWIEVPVPALPS
ncbi:hypothetical protein MMC17_005801 [Xylographa soralifera]|nr:hypothetical protein [Xylographa soralifera]